MMNHRSYTREGRALRSLILTAGLGLLFVQGTVLAQQGAGGAGQYEEEGHDEGPPPGSRRYKKDHEDHKRVGPPPERPYDPSDVTAYGELRKDLNGPYEEELTDPRPEFRTHGPKTYNSAPGPHPYEISLTFGFWANRLGGQVMGDDTAGAAEGELDQDDRTTYLLAINNSRAGFGVTQIKHQQAVEGAFAFNGVAFNADGSALLDSNFVLYDSFYRWCLVEWEDTWIDYLLGIKVIDADVRAEDSSFLTQVSGIAPLGQAGIMWRRQFAENIYWRGFLKGAGGGFSGSSATVFDIETELVYTFPGDKEYSRFNQFAIGYKYLGLNFSTEDEDSGAVATLNIQSHGPYAAASAYF